MTLSSAKQMRTMESTTIGIRTKDVLDGRSEEAPPTTRDKRQTRSPDPVCAWPKLTNFSIENILRKDFGSTIRKHGLGRIPLHHVRGHGIRKLGVDNIFRRSVISESDRRRRRDTELSSPRAVSPIEKPPTSPETPDERLLKSPESSATGSPLLWPAWVYCTRYSDRPSSGPRTRKIRSHRKKDEKRPRTAFNAPQLQKLRQEFQICNYLTEERRRSLAVELNLSESQIKIWFQNKRAKIKKANGYKHPLAMNLMTQGLYNHSTIPLHDDSSDDHE